MQTVLRGMGSWIPGVAVLFLGACATPGDYGDAPDGGATGYPAPFAQTGSFPTLSASGGAVARDVAQAILGPGASVEADANDPADPDGQPNLNPANTDADDGLVDLSVVLVSIPPPAGLAVNVTAPSGGGGAFWINVLIDLNLGGTWGGVAGPGLPEWVVRNFPVTLAAGESRTVTLPPFLFGFGNRLPDGAWMRVLLSRESVPGGDWDGSGRFSAGEVEDHVIRLPRVQGQKRVIIAIACDSPVLFPRGVVARGFSCFVRNLALGATAGSFSYNLTSTANGASVRVTPLGVAATGCAPPVPPAPPPGGPVDCGNPPGDIPIAGAGPVRLDFRAARTGGPLPSTWLASASGEDPPAVVTPQGVTLGFTDAVDFVSFAEVEVAEEALLELGDGELTLLMRSTDPVYPGEVRLRMGPGESFRGFRYQDLLEAAPGPVYLPAPE